MIQREIKRYLLKLEFVIQPILFFFLISIIVLSSLAFVNLTPKYSSINNNVLGVEDKKEIGAVLVGGTHNYINNESLTFTDKNNFEYSFTINNREAGEYSKPVIELVNKSSSDLKLRIDSYTQELLNSDINMYYKDKYLVLINSVGAISSPTVVVPAGSKDIAYISISNTNPIRYNQVITISFSVVE